MDETMWPLQRTRVSSVHQVYKTRLNVSTKRLTVLLRDSKDNH